MPHMLHTRCGEYSELFNVDPFLMQFPDESLSGNWSDGTRGISMS